MDQTKIGEFIKSLRKEKGYTQEQLATRLHVSSKTVSKWECGKGLPEASLMLSLSDELGITVNELLSGSYLTGVEYKTKAEENLIASLIERRNNRLLLGIQVVLGSLIIVSVLTLILVASLLKMIVSLRITLILIALIIMIGGIASLSVLDVKTGYFKCPDCKKTFVPTLREYVLSVHSFTKRKLKCPRCEKKRWCEKVSNRSEIQ